ncbi:MAG: flagellar export chaperone FliS [Desulfuromonadales bacterium]|nr:flagellar export chaperone FliS [Desulfuromonadales bacterium]MDW7757232.1 flagellar export chaperone FliS [Desulfuromonadales bacterium]
MNAYMNQYQNNQVSTATPEQLLVMLYDGAIRFVRQAIAALGTKNIEEKARYINKASAIVSEFRATLDHEIGGEIAAGLDDLYDFMLREMVKGNIKNDPEPLRVVENLLSDLRETWMQAIEINRQEKAPAQVLTAEYKPFQAAL